MFTRFTWRQITVAAAVVLLAGCGLINALDKVKGFTFMLPARTLTVSTNSPNWRSPPAEGIPPVPCGAGQPLADCCMAPGVDCMRSPLVCESAKCALKFTYEQVQPVDLSKDVESLKQYNGMIFSQVLLKQIDLTVDNRLNVSTPQVQLYVGKSNVMTASDPGAQHIATIPVQPPGFKGMIQVPLDAAGQQSFSNLARDFQTPFNIIMSTGILVKSGEPTPMGQVDYTVTGLVEVKL
jgi:hypothetical protein